MNYASMSAPSEQTTQRVSATVASAATTEITSKDAIVQTTALVFMVRGAAPVAVAHTSLPIFPNIPYRILGLKDGDKLAFITATGTADVYVTADN